MNFITPKGAVCGFPSATLRRIGALKRGKLTDREDHSRSRYQERGFTFDTADAGEALGFWDVLFFGELQVLAVDFRSDYNAEPCPLPINRTGRGWLPNHTWRVTTNREWHNRDTVFHPHSNQNSPYCILSCTRYRCHPTSTHSSSMIRLRSHPYTTHAAVNFVVFLPSLQRLHSTEFSSLNDYTLIVKKCTLPLHASRSLSLSLYVSLLATIAPSTSVLTSLYVAFHVFLSRASANTHSVTLTEHNLVRTERLYPFHRPDATVTVHPRPSARKGICVYTKLSLHINYRYRPGTHKTLQPSARAMQPLPVFPVRNIN